MSASRRQFLAETSLRLIGAATALHGKPQDPTKLPPGAPTAFGAGPGVGPENWRRTVGGKPWQHCTSGAAVRGNWFWIRPSRRGHMSIRCCRVSKPGRRAIDLCAAQPTLDRCPRTSKMSRSLAWCNSLDGSSRANSLRHA